VFDELVWLDREAAMTVAPELPPVLARRGGSRRLRVVVDRTPAGVVALVEPPRPRGPLAAVPASVVVPAAPVEPGIGREHRPADPIPRRRRPVARRLATPARADVAGVASVATGVVEEIDEAVPAPVGMRPERTRAVGSRPVGARVVRPAPGHLRLTRRGRLVTAAATLLIAVLTLVGVVSRAGALRETAPVPASAPAQVVVAPGETLWSIAERVAPDRDPRTVVAGIQRLNDLPTAAVRAGQTLRLRAP
jgi:LysM domain